MEAVPEEVARHPTRWETFQVVNGVSKGVKCFKRNACIPQNLNQHSGFVGHEAVTNKNVHPVPQYRCARVDVRPQCSIEETTMGSKIQTKSLLQGLKNCLAHSRPPITQNVRHLVQGLVSVRIQVRIFRNSQSDKVPALVPS